MPFQNALVLREIQLVFDRSSLHPFPNPIAITLYMKRKKETEIENERKVQTETATDRQTVKNQLTVKPHFDIPEFSYKLDAN